MGVDIPTSVLTADVPVMGLLAFIIWWLLKNFASRMDKNEAAQLRFVELEVKACAQREEHQRQLATLTIQTNDLQKQIVRLQEALDNYVDGDHIKDVQK